MGSYTVGVAGLTVNQLLNGSGGSTPSLPTKKDKKLWNIPNRMTRKRKIATLCLMIAMFLNPLGFDVMFAMILELTGSYWTTTGIFYLLSLSFFGLYFLFREKK